MKELLELKIKFDSQFLELWKTMAEFEKVQAELKKILFPHENKRTNN